MHYAVRKQNKFLIRKTGPALEGLLFSSLVNHPFEWSDNVCICCRDKEFTLGLSTCPYRFPFACMYGVSKPGTKGEVLSQMDGHLRSVVS